MATTKKLKEQQLCLLRLKQQQLNLERQRLRLEKRELKFREKLGFKEEKRRLELRKKELEFLREASELKQLYHIYYTGFDSAETWATRWVACPIAYLFPMERREEWLGDLHQLNWKMLYKGYPLWFVSINNIVRTVILVLAALRIKISDLL